MSRIVKKIQESIFHSYLFRSAFGGILNLFVTMSCHIFSIEFGYRSEFVMTCLQFKPNQTDSREYS